ncbi:MAG: aspartate aminotransferase family protein [Ruminococcaceae bacterium]|nr:aspartate aminotransferase family protein [Oscillospiraceae bacterium]
MDLQSIIKLDEQYYMNTFGKRTPVCFERGEGITLYDTEGNAYTDFFGGIAVNALGYGHPGLTSALTEQVQKLLHTSNLYYVKNQSLLAEKLIQHSVADKVFFANCGAEANESAIKLAKMYFYKKNQPEKSEIITLQNSFHGRTLACVAATGQEKYQKPYAPLTPGFKHVPLNDFEALKQAVDEKTAAIMVELVQGESGVHPMTKEYALDLAALCKEKDILLIVDEVQTGMGRTGTWFCYENYNIEPDIFTLAKGLGGGVPIGAVCAKAEVAASFSPGDHGGTFGGGPLATCAGLAVCEAFEKENLPENSREVGNYLKQKFVNMAENFPTIICVRGMGLMLGVVFSEPIAKKLQQAMFERKYLVGAVGDNVLRILPPLIITRSDADDFCKVLASALKSL